MIYIDSSTESLDLFIEKHSEPENSVKFSLIYNLDSSTVISDSSISVHENYYVYCLNASSLLSGQYEYQIVDVSALTICESGLLYKLSENQENQNIHETVIYER